MIYKRFTDKAAEEWRQIYKVGTDRDLILNHFFFFFANLSILFPESSTSRIPGEERFRACGRRRKIAHVSPADAPAIPLY